MGIDPAELRIVIVDNSRDNADVLGMLLAALGYPNVAVFYDGAAALAATEQEPPHVVLLDLAMPGISGFDVCGKLREEPRTSSAAIFAVTGLGEPAMKTEAERRGFDGYFLKPLDGAQLTAVMEQAARIVEARRNDRRSKSASSTVGLL